MERLKTPEENKKYAIEGKHQYINPKPKCLLNFKHELSVSANKMDCQKCFKKKEEIPFSWECLRHSGYYICPECAY